MLTDVSRQVDWPVDGQMQKLDEWEWKTIFTAALKKEQRIAAGIGGGFVMLGSRTSKMSIAEMSDLIDLMFAFGAERHVVWTDPEVVSLMRAA